MPRFFNTAGPCNPRDHYMLPPEGRLPDLRTWIERKLYFTLHAPRQAGSARGRLKELAAGDRG